MFWVSLPCIRDLNWFHCIFRSTYPSQNENFKVVDSLMPDAKPRSTIVLSCPCSVDPIVDAIGQLPADLLTQLMHFVGIVFQLENPFPVEFHWVPWSNILIDQIWLCSPLLQLLLQRIVAQFRNMQYIMHHCFLVVTDLKHHVQLDSSSSRCLKQACHHQERLSQEQRIINT